MISISTTLLLLTVYLVSWMLWEVFGQVAIDAMFRDPELARRRQFYRTLLKAGSGSLALALTAFFLCMFPLTAPYAVWTFLALTTLSAVLLRLWWVRAGRVHPQY